MSTPEQHNEGGEALALTRLAATARRFMDEANEATTGQKCQSDPCPYCTAGSDLQGAIMDAEDVLAAAAASSEASA